MAWQRYNKANQKFEMSEDNGVTWTPMMIDASTIYGLSSASNVAYTDQPNIFIRQQEIKSSLGNYAKLVLRDEISPVDSRVWQLTSYNTELLIQAVDDSLNTQQTNVTIRRNGHVSMGRLSLGTTALPTNSGDLVVSRDGHAGSGVIYFGSDRTSYLYRTPSGTFQLNSGTLSVYGTIMAGGHFQNNGGYVFPGRVEANGAIQSSYYLAASDTYGLYTNTGLYTASFVRTSGQFYEIGRNTAIGDWVDFPTTGYVDAQLTSQSGSMSTMLIGHTQFIHLKVGGSIAGNPTGSYFLIHNPYGRYNTHTYSCPMAVNTGGVWETGSLHGTAGYSYALLYRDNIQPWIAGPVYIAGQWFFGFY